MHFSHRRPAFRRALGRDFPRVIEAAYRNILLAAAPKAPARSPCSLPACCSLPPTRISVASAGNSSAHSNRTPLHQAADLRCTPPDLSGTRNYGFQARRSFISATRSTNSLCRKPLCSPHRSRAQLLADLARPARPQPPQHRALAAAARQQKSPPRRRRRQPGSAHSASGLARNDLAPYFVEELRQYLDALTARRRSRTGLRVYTSLKSHAARRRQAVRDGLHSYDRRHGWRGNLLTSFTTILHY